MAPQETAPDTDFTRTCPMEAWLSVKDVAQCIPGARLKGAYAGANELALFPYMKSNPDPAKISIARLEEQEQELYVVGVGRQNGVAYLAYAGERGREALLALIRETDKDRRLCTLMERVPPNTPVRLYLDLEKLGTEGEQFVWLKDTLNAVIDQLNKLLEVKLRHVKAVPVLGDDVVVTSASRPTDAGYKMSFHVIFPRIVFDSVDTLNSFARAFLHDIDGVDRGVYSNNRFFRLPYQRKFGGDDTTVLRPLGQNAATADLDNHLVVAPPNAEIAVRETHPKLVKKAKRVSLARPPAGFVDHEGEVPYVTALYLQKVMCVPAGAEMRMAGNEIQLMNPCFLDSTHAHHRLWQSRITVNTEASPWQLHARCRGNCDGGRPRRVPTVIPDDYIDALIGLVGGAHGLRGQPLDDLHARFVNGFLGTLADMKWWRCDLDDTCVVLVNEEGERLIVRVGCPLMLEEKELREKGDTLHRLFLTKAYLTSQLAAVKCGPSLLLKYATNTIEGVAQLNGRLYERDQDTGVLWRLLPESIPVYLETMFRAGPLAVREAWETAGKPAIQSTTDKIREAATIVPTLKRRACFALGDGIVDLNERLTFTPYEALRAAGDDPFLSQYEARHMTYAQALEPPTAATALVEAQISSADERDCLYALLGRAICYRHSDLRDPWQVFLRIYGASQTGKSTLALDGLSGSPSDPTPGVFGPRMMTLTGSQREGLGSLARFVADADVIVGTEMPDDISNPLYGPGALSHTNIKALASREPLNITGIYKEDKSAVVEAPMIIVNQNRLIGADYQPQTHAELEAYWRRQVTFSFTTPVPNKSADLARRCREERPRFALFCVRKYLEYRTLYDQSDKLPLVLEKRNALIQERHPFGQFLRVSVPIETPLSHMTPSEFKRYFVEWAPKWAHRFVKKHMGTHPELVAEMIAFFGPERCAADEFRPCAQRCGAMRGCGHPQDKNIRIPKGSLLGWSGFRDEESTVGRAADATSDS
jgi:hypothetical protein